MISNTNQVSFEANHEEKVKKCLPFGIELNEVKQVIDPQLVSHNITKSLYQSEVLNDNSGGFNIIKNDNFKPLRTAKKHQSLSNLHRFTDLNNPNNTLSPVKVRPIDLKQSNMKDNYKPCQSMNNLNFKTDYMHHRKRINTFGSLAQPRRENINCTSQNKLPRCDSTGEFDGRQNKHQEQQKDDNDKSEKKLSYVMLRKSMNNIQNVKNQFQNLEKLINTKIGQVSQVKKEDLAMAEKMAMINAVKNTPNHFGKIPLLHMNGVKIKNRVDEN